MQKNIMSSDFLEDIDDDEHGYNVLLSMNVYRHAFLTVSGPISEEDNSATYHLEPNETGWKNAEKIISALREWVEHSKRS